jgi:hypothetical protein
MGADCAGAVQILPVNTTPDTDAGSEPVDEDMIEKPHRRIGTCSPDGLMRS